MNAHEEFTLKYNVAQIAYIKGMTVEELAKFAGVDPVHLLKVAEAKADMTAEELFLLWKCSRLNLDQIEYRTSLQYYGMKFKDSSRQIRVSVWRSIKGVEMEITLKVYSAQWKYLKADADGVYTVKDVQQIIERGKDFVDDLQKESRPVLVIDYGDGNIKYYQPEEE